MITDAYTSVLNRTATPAERQFWIGRLTKLSPIAVLDLYDGLTRLPEYQKRFDKLDPKAKVHLMARTLLRQDLIDESIWIPKLQKNSLSDCIETMVESVDHKMAVYKAAGLSTQQEADAMHVAAYTTDPAKSADLFKSILAKGTKVPLPYFLLVRLQEGNPRQAAETLQHELDRFPDDCIAEFELSILAHQIGVGSRSFRHASNGFHISDEKIGADSLVSNMKARLDAAKHPELLSRELLLARGKAHKYEDHHDWSITEFDRVLAIGPGDKTVFLLRGDGYFNVGQYAKAIEDLTIAEKTFGPALDIVMDRGLSLVELGQYQRALPDLDKALKIVPWGHIYAGRAKCYGQLGKRKEQIADLTKLITLDPRSAKPLIARGKAYLSMGKYKEALADANKAVSVGRRYRESYKFRAECYMKLNNKAAAAADLAEIEKISKQFKDAEF